MTAVDTPPTVVELIEAARAERAAGMQLAVDADEARGGWDRKVIDQAVDAYAATGRPFSANDLREVLPDVRPALIGIRFTAASKAGRIRRIGYVTSTKPNTHAKPVVLWVGVPS